MQSLFAGIKNVGNSTASALTKVKDSIKGTVNDTGDYISVKVNGAGGSDSNPSEKEWVKLPERERQR